MTIPKTTTPAKLHDLASQTTSIPLEGLKLIFRGRIISKDLDDETSLVIDLFNLEDGSVIHCMGRPTVTAATTDNASTTTAPATNAIGSTVTPPSTTASSTTPSTSSTSSSNSTPLEAALLKIATATQSSPADHLLALETSVKIIKNITSNPMEEKYRSVKSTNPAFVKRLGRHDGSVDLMAAVGFESVEEKYVLKATQEAWAHVVTCQTIMETKVQEVQRRNSSQVGAGANVNASPLGVGGMGNMGMGNMGMGAGMGGMNPNDMATAMSQLRNNPEQVQAMMQNPMVQQMIRNDPRMANNPMMQQGLDMMMNNPQMLEQATRMMGDPAAMARMEQMSQMGGALGGGMGMPPANNGANGNVNFAQQMQMMQQMMGGNTGTGPGTQTSNSSQGAPSTSGGASGNNTTTAMSSNQTNSNSNNGGNQAMTEEEMIAEAIARSLRDS